MRHNSVFRRHPRNLLPLLIYLILCYYSIFHADTLNWNILPSAFVLSYAGVIIVSAIFLRLLLNTANLRDTANAQWYADEALADYIIKYWSSFRYPKIGWLHGMNNAAISLVSLGMGIYHTFFSDYAFILAVCFFTAALLHYILSVRTNRPQGITEEFLSIMADPHKRELPVEFEYREAIYGWFIMKELYPDNAFYQQYTEQILNDTLIGELFDNRLMI